MGRDLNLLNVVEELTTQSPECSNDLPRRVMKNENFLIDTSTLKYVNDILADDCGSWLNNGQRKYLFAIHDNGKIERIHQIPLDQEFVTLHRHHYKNRSSNDFRRTITFLTGMTFYHSVPINAVAFRILAPIQY